ncbi:phage baseplate assembly protein [Methylophaga thiooxydans]|uniref:Bacteriophage Mu P protein n=1 Tax=Methylophaga thiooxydans DMS010 TaxID=637616 RepID=C0N2F4_9GAMM|nr:hypothetical protein [Methylophaga thiooxydans]EEF78489.1 bacteriophage Mu P protein [Methylophaga thiooxydans DMS010]EEF78793.1 bacteriophage Mu P protein [Methylophaga thiooxydans DMS010]EEF78997.1 bacteriophage Mu P protein [Methylophaga thiooxydans DMS010]EEF79068.1 bacteriophage Mu P protein [Methylophaga thiooxydans DMS010]EEF79737.1 bacteriophage Mu P protein [Methylophaga thiooxydans DMS010]
MHDVALKVNGLDWYGWEEVRINRSIVQIANEFNLKLTDKWSENSAPRPINDGDSCKVTIDDHTVITGYIDEVDHSYDDSTNGIQVAGRDATGDLVDCSAPSFQWAGRNQLEGASVLCEPYGIPVSSTVDTSKPFATMKSDEGESTFEVLDTVAKIRAVLLVSDGLGGLKITRSGTRRLKGSLETGVNIKAGSRKRSSRERFSHYTVKGQTSSAWIDTVSVSATVADKAVTRHRPKIILAEDALDAAGCKARATWHRNISAAKAQTFNYTMLSWYLDDELIEPNCLIAVKDHYLNVNRDLLIVGITYIVDDKGLRAELILGLPEAFELQALPEPNDEGGVW